MPYTNDTESHRLLPFRLDRSNDYLSWREQKLAHAATGLDDLLVEVNDPRRLSAAEHEALRRRCRSNNMAVYASALADREDKDIPRALGAQFGLIHLDHNFLADDDAISSLSVNPEGDHPQFIPYTNRPIQWHTDGYYNPASQRIRGLILHCVRPAVSGGENALLDPELLYVLLRDEDPGHIAALMQADVMTIPAREDEEGIARPAQTGPVFSVGADGNLHVRYTARKRSIEWKPEPGVRAAVAAMERHLASDLPFIVRTRLEAGMGLVSNNVLHDRSRFQDPASGPGRLLYRARYYDRMAGTGWEDPR
jgi:hypothetical protein